MRKIIAFSTVALLVAVSGCKTANSAVDGVKSVGETVANGVGSVPSLVNVNLSNVLNNLALDLHIEKANIPINAQIPINIAANVCGVSINVLSIGAGGSSQGCTANSISPELKQYIQEQLAANGSVGGGAQTTTGTTAGTTGATGTVTTGTTGTATTTVPTTSTTTQPTTGTTPQ